MLKGLTQKVTLATTTFLILIALVLALVLLSITSLRAASAHLTDELIPQLDAKGDFNTSVARTLGELESFLGSGEAGELEEAQEAFSEAQEALASLTTLAAVVEQQYDPEERALAQAILERQTTTLAAIEGVIADAPTPDAAIGEQIDQLHTELEALEDATDAVLDDNRTELTEELATSVQSAYGSAGVLGMLCIGLALLALLMVRRTIVQPVITLASVAEQVTGGRLDQRVPMKGWDEIGTVQRSFNTMVTTLHQQTQQLQQHLKVAEAAQAAAEDASAKLTVQLRMIEEQRGVIREMSVPILPLSDHALVMPLVGTLDTARLQLALQRALHAIAQRTTRYALLDITGVPLIDTQVGRGLLNIIQAARLLGTEVVLVGIRPEVAQTIVQLGIPLDQVTVRSTLQDGITYAFNRS
jgi:rsbT co-antagonist protein RsbR